MSNKEIVWMDFHNKVVYLAEKWRVLGWSVPATVEESEAFVTHFLKNGRKECTFKELKQYVDFHGTRKDGRVYATIKITDDWLFVQLLQKNANLQRAMSDFVIESLGHVKNDELKQLVKKASANAIKAYLKALESDIDKYF